MAFAQRIITSNSAGDQEFTFTFDYIKEEHIKVFVNFVEINQGTGSNEFQVITNTTPKKISLNTGLSADNTRVEIKRISSLSTPLVNFEDGSTLTAADLDTAEKQSLFIDQELDDALKQGVSIDPTTGLPTLSNQRLTNVLDPVNAQDAVTKAYLERSGSITSTQIADGTIVNADVNASAAIAGTKISPDFGSQNIATTGTVDGRDVSADGTKLDTIETSAKDDQTGAEIKTLYEAESNTNAFTDALLAKLNAIEANAKDDQTVSEIKTLIAGSPLDASHLAANSVGSSEIVNSSVTNNKLANAELVTLAGMQSGTASKLADSTALTSDIADLNQLDGMAKQTTITDDDTKFPTSGAVVDYVSSQLDDIGGFESIANELSFPNTQAPNGVSISIADAAGIVVNGSGVSTTARTLNGTTVTINNIPSNFHSSTIASGIRFIVTSTGSGQIYNYHKATLSESDLVSLSGDINDFNERYRIGSTNPDTNNDSGDLFFNTSTGKLLVYNGTNSAWEEAQSIGNFFISTLSPAFDNSTQNFTITNAPTNAQQILLSINGVIQKPNSGTSTPSEGFALDGSTVKLAAAPASGSEYFAVVIGSTVNIGTPSNNTVTSAILQNGSVIEAKLGSGAVTRTKLNLVSTSSAPGLEVKGDGTSDGYLQLNCSQNSHGVKIKSPPHSANQNYTLTLPSALPAGEGFLISDQNGNTSFTTEVGLISDQLRVHDLYLGRDSSNNDPVIQPAAQANITLRCGSTQAGTYTSILDGSGLQLGRNTQYVKLKAPADQTGQSSYDFTFPISGGSNGQFLKTDGNGTTSWGTVDLTSLSASNLTSGTVPDARFPATLPAASAANLTNIPAANITGTLPAIDGSNLTGLSGVSVASQANNRLITCTGTSDSLTAEEGLEFVHVNGVDPTFTFKRLSAASGNDNIYTELRFLNSSGTVMGQIICRRESSTDNAYLDFETKNDSQNSQPSMRIAGTTGTAYFVGNLGRANNNQPSYFSNAIFGGSTIPSAVTIKALPDGGETGLLIRGTSMGGGSTDINSCIRVDATASSNNAQQYGIYVKGKQQNDKDTGGIYADVYGSYSETYVYRGHLQKQVGAYTIGTTFHSKITETSSGGASYHMRCYDGSNLKLRIERDGDIDNTNNSYGSLSDIKLKENIVDAKSQWDDIKALKVRNFNFKDDPNKVKMLGLVAQEAEIVSAGLVKTNNDLETDKDTGEGKVTGQTKYLKYSILYMKAIKALQEAQVRIETLETKVAALESK